MDLRMACGSNDVIASFDMYAADWPDENGNLAFDLSSDILIVTSG